MTAILHTLWALTLEMAPYLLFGFFAAGLLSAFVSQTFYRKHLSRPGFRSVLTATCIGVPLPLCSCGVIPTTVALRRAGASRGACVAFLIATPQTGVDSILATYSLLGLPFAVLRPVAALVTGLVGGWVTDATLGRDDNAAASQTAPATASAPVTLAARMRKVFAYGFGELMEDVGRWLLLGLVVAALITELVPEGFFLSLHDYPIVNILLVLVVAIPMYLCATGSIPIALSLMLKGLTPGAALVMLMAGPAVNAASLLVVGKALGRRQMYAYIGSIVCGAVGFGLLIDYVLPPDWFSFTSQSAHCCTDHSSAPWYTVAASLLFLILLLRALIARHLGHNHNHQTLNSQLSTLNSQLSTLNSQLSTLNYSVKGMRCSHCAANCQQAVQTVPGVTSVEVDLPTGRVTVCGDFSDAAVREAIAKAGYTAV